MCHHQVLVLMCVNVCDGCMNAVPNSVAEQRNVPNSGWVGSLLGEMIDWQLSRAFMERWEECLMHTVDS